MALGNLAIKVVADIGGFASAMDGAAQSAKSNMDAASGSVNAFASSLMRESVRMQNIAMAMGGSMVAANDMIAASSAQSVVAMQAINASANQSVVAIQAIDDAAKEIHLESTGEKIAHALGAGVGAGVVAGQTALGAFESYVKTKLIITGLAIATGIAAAAFTAVYAVYKVADSIVGMMNGTFYKSENIDALIASNNELKELQKNLGVSSIEAGALNETFNRLGVSAGDYKTVQDGVTSSLHTNTDELNRLKVTYKDANGKLLENHAVLVNAKAALDAYTEGWDRNQAAVAIGMGSYEQITETLKVSADQVQISKARLDQYQLGISTGTQEMVKKYETSMREFDRENDLMAKGFQRVYADAVIPLYTSMANTLKDGWPSIISATRIGSGVVMAAFYAMADGIYIAWQSIKVTFLAMATGLEAMNTATTLFFNGDFKGAKNALAKGWEDAKGRIKIAGSDIIAQVMANNNAINTAFGNDDRSASIDSAKKVKKTGKSWVKAPEKKEKEKEKDDPPDDVAKRFMEGALKVREDFIADEKTLMQTRQEFLKSDYASDLISATSYYGERQRLIAENMAKTSVAYDAEIKDIEYYIEIHKTESDKDADIVAQKNKIAEIRNKQKNAEIAGNKEIALSYLDLSNEKAIIAQSFLKDDELENKQNQKRLGVLEAFRDQKLENVIEGNRLIEEENKRHGLAISGMQASNDLQALSQAASVGDQMLTLLKNGGHEKTALFKALFLVNKAIAVAEILINTEVGAAKALGFGPFGIPMAAIIRGLGYASAGIVAGTALADVSAAGGYDIPAGIDPIVQTHASEMILPKAQADVVRGLAKNGSSGGGDFKLTMVSNGTPQRVVESQRISPTEWALIVEDAKKATIASLYESNSKASKAMHDNFGVQRRRS